VFLSCTWRPAGGEADRQGVARLSQKATPRLDRQAGAAGLSVLKAPTGEQVLVIDYPWKAYTRSSIEVRLVTDEKVDAAGIRPLLFRENYLKGDLWVGVYRCEDGSADLPTRMSVTSHKIDFEIIGRRNSLSKPSTCVARRIDLPDGRSDTEVAYCLLDSWAVNKRMLYLDLPQAYFSEPGRIRVCFLRGRRVLWSQTTAWTAEGK